MLADMPGIRVITSAPPVEPSSTGSFDLQSTVEWLIKPIDTHLAADRWKNQHWVDIDARDAEAFEAALTAAGFKFDREDVTVPVFRYRPKRRTPR